LRRSKLPNGRRTRRICAAAGVGSIAPLAEGWPVLVPANRAKNSLTDRLGCSPSSWRRLWRHRWHGSAAVPG